MAPLSRDQFTDESSGNVSRWSAFKHFVKLFSTPVLRAVGRTVLLVTAVSPLFIIGIAADHILTNQLNMPAHETVILAPLLAIWLYLLLLASGKHAIDSWSEAKEKARMGESNAECCKRSGIS